MNENHLSVSATPRNVKDATGAVAQHEEITALDTNLLANGKYESVHISTHLYTQGEIDHLIDFLKASKSSFLKTKKTT